ncbi:hypothetical protein GTA51_19985 [Desulfovibrio aerotolerans]|uniref:Uncharacterized protein n=1 Tax=Solidesulfovibrio aerotolerans TaxID=295255 RepID=A0A7C9MXI8_9BACT|nr:C45 family autoproteolytic acyltransferase/hydolase [Solidesulfovibrio aerotolerans]MYL85374.1 hypothetical protein [Solidesulfovibrio aerotolerans]
MLKSSLVKIFLIVMLSAVFSISAVSSSQSKPVSKHPAVKIIYDKKNLHYKVEFDLTSVSHKEMGRQYALALVDALPQFERFTDAALLETLKEAKMTFQQALDNVNALKPNIPKEYLDEFEGMGQVFSDPSDEVGNGRLSPNKIFVSVIFEDVTDSAACSASAVFGKDSATGKTILGRNNDWPPDEEIDKWGALFIFHNGGKSVAGNGFLGELFPTNVFNRHHVFGGSLASYPSVARTLPLTGMRSPTIDLRYAIESSRTLADAEAFLSKSKYATGSVIIVADPETAHVLEYDTSRAEGQRARIRTSASELIPGESWDIPTAIACVNSFVLPGGFDNHDAHNKLRFGNFNKLFRSSLVQGPVGVDQMQGIMGYTSWDGNSKTSGAIFRLGIGSGTEQDSATFQSFVIKLDTFESWMAYTAHGARWPYKPVYHKVLDGDPFKQ